MARHLCAVVLVALALAPLAMATRPPTHDERLGITMALPKHFRDAPVKCVWINIRVSRNPRYAWVAAEFWENGPRCARYAHNGWWIVKKTDGVWRRIYSGSVDPPCRMRIPRDIGGCGR